MYAEQELFRARRCRLFFPSLTSAFALVCPAIPFLARLLEDALSSNRGIAFQHELPRHTPTVLAMRKTTLNVLPRKRTESPVALLLQLLSGYAFLLTMKTNPRYAKEIRAVFPANITARTFDAVGISATQSATASPGAKP